jgi:hypothetical protein
MICRLTVGRSARSRVNKASGPSDGEGEGGASAATPCWPTGMDSGKSLISSAGRTATKKGNRQA